MRALTGVVNAVACANLRSSGRVYFVGSKCGFRANNAKYPRWRVSTCCAPPSSSQGRGHGGPPPSTALLLPFSDHLGLGISMELPLFCAPTARRGRPPLPLRLPLLKTTRARLRRPSSRPSPVSPHHPLLLQI